MIGNGFLSFVDEADRLRCKRYLRFMDDFVLFDNNKTVLLDDLNTVQRLLGAKGLSLNPQKTKLPDEPDTSDIKGRLDRVRDEVEAIREELLELRMLRLADYGGSSDDDDNEAGAVDVELSDEQTEYLLDLLRNEKDLDELDAELILALMSEHVEDVLPHLQDIIRDYPNLTKAVHRFSSGIADRDALASFVLKIARDRKVIMTEFQLFWLIRIVEDRLLRSRKAEQLIQALFDHPNSTTITRAKLLEIPETRFGMPERRDEVLRSGQSDWCAWAAAVGAVRLEKSRRNYVLGSFSNASAINRLIGECVARLP